MRFWPMKSLVSWPLTNQRLPSDKIILRVLKHMAAWKLIPLLIFFGNFVWENVIFLCNYNCSGLKQPGSGDKSQFNIRDQPRLQVTHFSIGNLSRKLWFCRWMQKLWEIIKGWWEGSTLQFESRAKHYHQKPQQPTNHYSELFHQLTHPALLDTEYFKQKLTKVCKFHILAQQSCRDPKG